MTPEQKLGVLLAAAEPPARDYAFLVEVSGQLARRRAWMSVMRVLPPVVVASVALWGLGLGLAIESKIALSWPGLEDLASPLTASALAGILALFVVRRVGAH